MENYCNLEFQQLLRSNGLDDFHELQTLVLKAVDKPNTNRGGHSEVAKLYLKDSKGIESEYFIKRQCNHLTRSFSSPFGEPTFRREFHNILLCQEREIATLDVVFYAEEKTRRSFDAILITKALTAYKPFTEYLRDWKFYTESYRIKLLTAVARLIAHMHLRGICHRCCYPKHLFINIECQPQVIIIDLETARLIFRPKYDAVKDLETFIRRSEILSESEIDTLYKVYLSIHQLGISFSQHKRQFLKRKTKRSKMF